MPKELISTNAALFTTLKTKIATKPLRPRVETYAFTKDNKVLSGLYPDGSVGVFGGGTDGDRLETAAKKEYREEGGRLLKNVEKIQGAKPFTQKWKDDPSVNSNPNQKQKKRMEQYSGSKTVFMKADLGGKAKVVDGHKLKGVKARLLDELIDIQKKSLSHGDKLMLDVKKARLEVLKKLKAKTAAAIEEPAYFPYSPVTYAHELGHHKHQQSLGRLGKAVDVAPAIARVLGGMLLAKGVMSKNKGMEAAGMALQPLADAPQLIDEAMASRHALKLLKERLTEEEYNEAKKRLAYAGLTYTGGPAARTLGAGLSLGSLLTKNPKAQTALRLSGLLTSISSPLAKELTAAIGEKGIGRHKGKRMTADDIKNLHRELGEEAGLLLSNKLPSSYSPPRKGKERADVLKWLEDKPVQESAKQFADKGGIILRPM